MKNLFSVFCLFLLSFLISANDGNAVGFNSIHTPDGVYVIAVGDNGLIFRSSNGGNTWASYSYNSEDLRSVYSVDNDVWFTGENGNIYKTGKSNSAITNYNVGSSFTVNSVYFIDANTGYVCGSGGSIYRSTNGGADWTPSMTGIPNEDLNGISFVDNTKGVVVGNNGTIYTTSDGGVTWMPFNTITDKNLLDVKYFTGGIIIAGEYGTLITSDATGLWNSIDSRTNSDIRAISGTSYTTAHVAGGGGFIRNNMSGSSEFLNFEINPMMANLVDLYFYNDDLGFAVSSLNNAIIRTTNGGMSWELTAGASASMSWVQKSPSGSGIGNNLCMHPTDRNSAFVVYGNKVYVSRDKAETWTQIATVGIGSRAHSFYVSPIDTNIWLAAMENSPDCIVRTTNYGATWTNILARDFSTYGQPLEMDQNDPNNFYFAPSNSGGEGVYKSTDVGATFTKVASYNNSGINQPCDLIIRWDHPNEIYMGDDGADIWKSTDGAATWTLVKPGSSSEVPSMCNSIFDNTFCYATTWSSPQVFRTTDSGDNWSIVSNNSGSGWGSDVCREDPTVVLTGNYGSQSWLTTNGGVSFATVSMGLSGAGAGIMVPERGYLLNMQTGSLFKLVINYSILTSTSENIISSVPSSYDLSQNYPNPFNPSTTIKFTMPEQGNVSLKVFDRLGREVADLVSGYRNVGTYEISFDASQLSSGIYFYKLSTDNFVSTKKMTLIK